MLLSSKKGLLSLAAAAAVVLTAAAATPAQARSGDLHDSPTVKYLMRGANIRQEAARQTATAPSFNDTSGAAVVVYDVTPSGNGIIRRRTLPN